MKRLIATSLAHHVRKCKFEIFVSNASLIAQRPLKATCILTDVELRLIVDAGGGRTSKKDSFV